LQQFVCRDSNVDGKVLVGVDGRGYLTTTGGTLNGIGLKVAGEDIATGSGPSLVDLSGTAAVNISNGATVVADFGRRVSVTGPNVSFNATGDLILESTNTLTANITSATAHSPLTTASDAVVSGSLLVTFSGAAATHDPIATLGQTWDLIHATGGPISGSFSNLSADGNVIVSAITVPAGAAYRLQTVTFF
jgi:hypothetical protein